MNTSDHYDFEGLCDTVSSFSVSSLVDAKNFPTPRAQACQSTPTRSGAIGATRWPNWSLVPPKAAPNKSKKSKF